MMTETNITSDSEDVTIGEPHRSGIIRGGRSSSRGRRARQFPPGFTLLSFPSLDGDTSDGGDSAVEASELLGNDFVFFTAFLTAFLFNWIGFLLLMCFCHTIAARYVKHFLAKFLDAQFSYKLYIEFRYHDSPN